jgi:aerobic C4-dicarboxylate transport protein
LNDWFIASVKMIVIPVVFCVVTTGIASMDNLRKAGRIGIKSIGYFHVLFPPLRDRESARDRERRSA